jgi:hypothetical protein
MGASIAEDLLARGELYEDALEIVARTIKKGGTFQRGRLAPDDFPELVRINAFEAGLEDEANYVLAEAMSVGVSGLGEDPHDKAAEEAWRRYMRETALDAALNQVDGLLRRTEMIDDKYVGFREATLDKIRGIGQTISAKQWVTDKQQKALDRIDKAIRRKGV